MRRSDTYLEFHRRDPAGPKSQLLPPDALLCRMFPLDSAHMVFTQRTLGPAGPWGWGLSPKSPKQEILEEPSIFSFKILKVIFWAARFLSRIRSDEAKIKMNFRRGSRPEWLKACKHSGDGLVPTRTDFRRVPPTS